MSITRATYILGCLLLLFCAVRARKKNGKLANIVCAYEVAACVCGILFMIYSSISNAHGATLLQGLINAGVDWVLLLLMAYTQHYTEQFERVKIVRNAMIVYAAIDTLLMLSNAWTWKIFYVYITSYGAKIVCYGPMRWIHIIHNIYAMIVLTIMLTAYCVVIIRTSKFYRIRYVAIGLTFLFGGVASIFASRANSMYNLSFLLFCLMSVSIYYFSLCYVPNELLQKTFALLIQDMNNGVICFDNLGRCIYCNDVVKDLYQIGENLDRIEETYRSWYAEKQDDPAQSLIYRTVYPGKDGINRNYEIIFTRLYDEKKAYVGAYFIFYDRTEEQQKFEREQYRASHDSLTGLLNKEQFYVDTYRLLHEYPDEKFYMICSNIESFKFVNDIFGIAKGDAILRKQAQSMESYAKEKVLSARLQGDRFAMCIAKSQFSEERLCVEMQKMEDGFTNNAFNLRMFAGVYEIEDIEEPVSIMCDKANIASETIKNNYQQKLAFYDTAQLVQSMKEKRIIGEFDRALSQDEFVMFLQPQVDAKGHVLGAEALVRWEHPEKGILAPGVFMDVLEKTGIVYKLDRYMWEKAAQKLHEWKQKEIPYHISVNISTKDFFFLDIYETFVQLIEKYEIEPERLKLEITETTLMSDFDKNMEILSKLQTYGFQIEIDDFGSGYSSLNMLRNISANVLKIDREFLKATENEGRDQDILQSIVILAEKIGMSVIVEGVETEKQLKMLMKMGCKLFQGYYFSKPLSVSDFEERYISI